MCDSAPITVTITDSSEPPQSVFPVVPVAIGLGALSVVGLAYLAKRKKK